MSKKIYNLWREKIKLEKEKDEILLELLQRALAETEWTYTKRYQLLEKLKKLTRNLAVIQQQLELELSSAILE